MQTIKSFFNDKRKVLLGHGAMLICSLQLPVRSLHVTSLHDGESISSFVASAIPCEIFKINSRYGELTCEMPACRIASGVLSA